MLQCHLLQVRTADAATPREVSDVMTKYLHGALSRHSGGSPVVLQNTACIPGCVLLLAEAVLPAFPSATDTMAFDDGSPPHGNIAAFADGVWNVGLSYSSSGGEGGGGGDSARRSHVHLRYESWEEFEGGMKAGEMPEGLVNWISGKLPAGEAAQVEGEGKGRPPIVGCFCAIAQHDEQLKLRLVVQGEQREPGRQDTNSSSSGRSVKSAAMSGYPSPSAAAAAVAHVVSIGKGIHSRPMRMVMSQAGRVLLHEVRVPEPVAGVSDTADARGLCLALPGRITSSSSNNGSRLEGEGDAAAAVSVYLLSHRPATAAAAKTVEVTADAAVADDDADDGISEQDALLAHGKVLLLPKAVVDELLSRVQREQPLVSQLAPLVSDMAFVLETRQLLQQARASAAAPAGLGGSGSTQVLQQARASASAAAGGGASGTAPASSSSTTDAMLSPSGAPASAAAAAAAGGMQLTVTADALAAMGHLATTAADQLLEHLTRAELPAAADFITVIKQQVLVGMWSLGLTAAAGGPKHVGAREGGASSAGTRGLDGGVTAKPRGGNCDGDAVLSGGPEAAGDSGQRVNAGKTAAAAAEGAELSGSYDAAAMSKSKLRGQEAGSTGNSSSSGKLEGGAGLQGAGSPQRDMQVVEEDVLAAAQGGWQGVKLCWRGFREPATEAAYVLFKSHHLRVLDWVNRGLNLGLLLPFWLYRHLQMVGWRLWPLQPMFGKFSAFFCTTAAL